LQPAGTFCNAASCPAAGGESKSQQQPEYYKRAAEARRLAKETSDPEEKVDLFDVEKRWLSLARDTPDEEDLVR
jgi:PAB1-binding protein PBP1